MAKRKDGKRICKCECGGQVRSVWDFGRLWTWCEKCTPGITVKPSDYRTLKCREPFFAKIAKNPLTVTEQLKEDSR